MIKKLLVLALAFSFLSSRAAVITLDQSITLSPEQKSQTLSFSLDEIPSKLIKKGNVKDGSVKLKFKLSKKDKQKFTLSPANGKLTVDVTDGIVSPASLTITANDETELGTYKFTVSANKKFRKSVSKKRDTLEYNNVKTLTGQVDLSNIVSTSSLRDGIDPSSLVVEIYDFDRATKALGELIAQTTTDIFGGFSAEIPSSKDLGPEVVCQATLSDNTPLRTFATTKDPVINAQADYFYDFITSSDIDLLQVPDVDFAAILEQVIRENLIGTTVQGVQDKADDIYAPSLNKFAENNGSGNTKLPGQFKGFSAKFLLGQAVTGDDEGQPIIGQHFGATVNKAKAAVDTNQAGVFKVDVAPFRVIEFAQVSPINDFNNQGQEFFELSEFITEEAKIPFTPTFTTVNNQDNCLLMSTSSVKLVDAVDFSSTASSVIYDAIFEEESGFLAGAGAVGQSDKLINGSDEEDALRSAGVELPIYVQSIDDLNGDSGGKNKKRNFASLASLSTIILLGFSALSVDFERLAVTPQVIQGSCDSSVLAALSVYRNECGQVSNVSIEAERQEQENQAAQYIFDGNIVADEQNLADGVAMGNYDWSQALAENTVSFEIKEPGKAQQNEADLLLKPLFGNVDKVDVATESVSAFRFRDVLVVSDLTGSLDDESDDADSSRILVEYLYDMTNSKNGLPLVTSNEYKLYGVMYEFTSTTAAVSQISGKATVSPGTDNSYNWLIQEDTYTKNTSSLANTDPNNLVPSQSTDSAAATTVSSIYNPGNRSHVFNSLHGSSRSCQFPDENKFFCQIFSTNLGDDSDNSEKSVGIMYGLRVENQPTQE